MNNKKMEQTLESLSTRHDHLVQDLEAAKKILADEEDENERLTEQLRVIVLYLFDLLICYFKYNFKNSSLISTFKSG